MLYGSISTCSLDQASVPSAGRPPSGVNVARWSMRRLRTRRASARAECQFEHALSAGRLIIAARSSMLTTMLACRWVYQSASPLASPLACRWVSLSACRSQLESALECPWDRALGSACLDPPSRSAAAAWACVSATAGAALASACVGQP